jgi:hypothetical protein
MAKDFFGFTQDNRMHVHIGDGIDYIRSLATAVDTDPSQQADMIMIDVDSKDVTSGMSSPPPAFVDEPFLRAIKKTLTPNGMLVLNLVARSRTLYAQTIATIKSVFAQVLELRTEQDVNIVVFAFLTNVRRPMTPVQIMDIGTVLANNSCASPESAQIVKPLFLDRTVFESSTSATPPSSTSATSSTTASKAKKKPAAKGKGKKRR